MSGGAARLAVGIAMCAWLPVTAAAQEAGTAAEAPLPADDSVAAEDEVIVIEEAAPRREAATETIESSVGARVPGGQGDAVKAVQTVAGVARSAAGTSGLVVWGASPSDTRLYVDDVPVPRLFHIGGSRSILPSSSVASVNLVPGGFGAGYGRAIGGLVRVETAGPLDADANAVASISPIDVSAAGQTRWNDATWSSVGARYSLLSRSFDAVADERATELIPVPDFWDYHASTHHRFGNGDRLRITVFGAHDRVQRGIPSLTPDAAFTETSRASFHRIGARLSKRRGAAVTTIALWAGPESSRTDLRFGDVVALAREDAMGAGVRVSETRIVGAYVSVRTGLDVELSRTAVSRDGAIALPAREGDIGVFGQPPGNRVNMDAWTVDAASIGAYGEATLRVPGTMLSVVPGLRFEPSVLNGDRVLPVRSTEPAVGYTELDVAVDPRLKVTWRATDALELYTAAGRYHQAPTARDLSPVFGSPVLDPARATHVLAGAIVQPVPWLSVDVTGFWTRQDHLAVRSELATPALAALLTSDGVGRNYGAQLSARATPSPRLLAWVTYALMRAERRDQPGEPWRLFDADQTHSLQAVASWRHPTGLELGGRVELTSGFPRTPVDGAVFNTASATYDPLFGAHNSIRIPTFFELSLRAAWTHTATWGVYTVWLDVKNATNRANAEEFIYTSDFARQDVVHGLPILPLVGAELRL